MTRPNAILVTGAAGFIGSSLVDRLLRENRRVIGLDNFDPFYPRELKHENLRRASRSRDFRLIEADIRGCASLARSLRGEEIDAVVHLAALAGVRPSLERPSEYADVNVRGSCDVVELARQLGVNRMVFASSSSVYGERASEAFSEGDATERPISPYAATKRAAELSLHSFHYIHGIDISCLRIFTAYGPRQRPDLAIRKFAERMLRGDPIPVYGDGSSRRDFTYIDDLVDGVTLAIDKSRGFQILNLGAGRTVKLIDVIQTLEQALGQKAKIEWLPRQPGDVSNTWADVSAARRVLGYAPRVQLSEGIERFARWLKSRSEDLAT